MVWACHTPRWVAQTLQQMNGFRAEMAKEVGESREQNKASALRPTSATEIFQLLVTDLADAPRPLPRCCGKGRDFDVHGTVKKCRDVA
jgi:hypothetical protein